MSEIKFYSTKGEYGFMSNFSRHPIKLRGATWPTTEHYFQAQKFAGTCSKSYMEIMNADSPMDAARMGRDRKRPLRKDWEEVKDDVMLHAVRAKFEQNKTLRDELLATGEQVLIEHTKNDSYWGDGGDGSGQNMLGRILMQVRAELRGGNPEIVYVAFAGVDGHQWGWDGPGWYHYGEDWVTMFGPFEARNLAKAALDVYTKELKNGHRSG